MYKKDTDNRTLTIADGEINTEYTIKGIDTSDEDMRKFLFTLGCYENETITIISILKDNYIITVKDDRYSIGKDLAKAILI
ncbi:MAG: ferrous iron transport protein A [Treponema sp.]|nr:MAG: ferrous iron transport protein A [Treponema sp.]